MSINKVVESIDKLHGGPRSQVTKHISYMAWQIAQRQKAGGAEPSTILKKEIEDDHHSKG